MAVKELSGILSDPGKWEATLAALASVESDVETLRIYHNTPSQLQSACRVLGCNSSVRTLDIGDAAAEGAIALEKLLQVNMLKLAMMLCAHMNIKAAMAYVNSLLHAHHRASWQLL